MRDVEFAHPVEAPSAANRVTDELRASILASRLKAGQDLSLRQIASQHGVSFIPVREALRSLEAEGLLITRRGRSATVTPLSHEELDGVFGLRRQIEPELAATAAPLHRAEELNRLESLLIVCKDPTTNADQHANAHIAFHLGLLRPATTTMTERLVESLVQAASRYERIVIEPIGSPPEQHLAEEYPVWKMLAAFRTRDPKTAHDSVLTRVNYLESQCRRAVPLPC
jgi:DNA-binding GntR family transcriptional regulator